MELVTFKNEVGRETMWENSGEITVNCSGEPQVVMLPSNRSSTLLQRTNLLQYHILDADLRSQAFPGDMEFDLSYLKM